jgi:hypothetical protein
MEILGMKVLGMVATFMLFGGVTYMGYKAYVKINFVHGTRDKQINSFIITSVLIITLLTILTEVLLFKFL